MPGGLFDSSKTRVAPFFERLYGDDPSARTWLPSLLALPKYGSESAMPRDCGSVQEHAWGGEERALQAPLSLLSWLIRNLGHPTQPDRSSAWPKRQKLISGDAQVIEEGLNLLRSGPSFRGWHVLEGGSFPDAFIATEQVVVVVEGKRTERGPTTKTMWMPARHQILRHMDAAFEIVGRRRLFGFFLVEGEADGAIPPQWVQHCSETLAAPAIEGSLPHRSEKERGLIAQAFLGVATWQMACQALSVPFDSLPERVAG